MRLPFITRAPARLAGRMWTSAKPVEVERDPEIKAAFAEAAAVEQWWSSERWSDTHRPYAALEVVKMRGTFPGHDANGGCHHASSGLADKAYEMFRAAQRSGTTHATFGALDVVQARPHGLSSRG